MKLTDINFLRPSEYQQRVLVLVFMAQTETIAFEFTVGDSRLQTAAETLNDLGLIEYDKYAGTAEMTDEGIDLMKRTALLSDDEELTTDAKNLVAANEDDV